jgi:hypothetical protein
VLLHEDAAFIGRMQTTLVEAGVMRAPVFDASTCQLVDGGLRSDLLYGWHESRQLTKPDTPEIVESWVRPTTLAEACYFGRVDFVRRRIAERNLRGASDGVSAAIGAFCVTPLHVECVRALLEAGVAVTQEHFDTLAAESIGSELDAELAQLLESHTLR